MILLILPTLLSCSSVLGFSMEVLHEWSLVDFTFPSRKVRDQFLSSGRFVPENNVILDVDVWNGQGRPRVFVTLPQFRPGIPASLATVAHSALLDPYPDWSWHQGGCDSITSVYRIMIDKCERLWVMDTGTRDSFVRYKRICQPQILVFDLNTNRLIRRYRFPDSLMNPTTQLATIVVDTRSMDCGGSVAYIADPNESSLYVYDYTEDKAWRVNNKHFRPCPMYGDLIVSGVDFELMDGIFGLALGQVQSDGERTLYFHSLASVHEGYVNTSVIRNSSEFGKNSAASYRSFQVFKQPRSSQSAVEAMTDSGVLLFTLVQDNAIGCWNSLKPFEEGNLDVIAKDDVTLQFQSGIKVVGDYVYTLSNRLQNYIVGNYTVRRGDYNMRVNVGKISELLQDTRCEQTIPSDIVFPLTL